MKPFQTHQQFTFTAEQQEMMVALSENVRATLDNNRRHAENHNSSQQRIIELQEQLAKFVYHLTEEPTRKISLSTPLLMYFLFKLLEELRHKEPEPVRMDAGLFDLNQFLTPQEHVSAQDQAIENKKLALYYFLSFDYACHYAYVELDHFYDQDMSAEELEKKNRFARRYINTAGMDEVAVFTALYNAANPQGYGFIEDDPNNITEEQGKALMEANKRDTYDYVNGRSMKLSISDLKEGYIDVTTYEKYNGDGVAQAAVAHLPRW